MSKYVRRVVSYLKNNVVNLILDIVVFTTFIDLAIFQYHIVDFWEIIVLEIMVVIADYIVLGLITRSGRKHR